MNQKVFGLKLGHAVLESQDFVRCGIWNAVLVDLIGGCRRGSGGLASVSPLGGGLGLEKPQADYPQGFWAQAVTWAPL